MHACMCVCVSLVYTDILQVSLFAATHDALVAPKDLEFLQEVLPAETSETLYFDKFSHLTWLVGKSDVEQWLDTFVESIHNHTLD